MATDTSVQTVIINKGKLADLPATKDPTQFYLATDAKGPTTVVIRRW